MALYLSAFALVIFLSACTSPPNERADPAFFITSFDLQQAKYVERFFQGAPEIKGRFSVTPGSSETRVNFRDNLPDGKEELFVDRMKQLKAEMAGAFKRPVNEFVFVFPAKVIKL